MNKKDFRKKKIWGLYLFDQLKKGMTKFVTTDSDGLREAYIYMLRAL